MKIILDTNVLLVSLAPHLKYHWVYKYIIDGKYDLILSNEILLEYTEKIAQRFSLDKTEISLKYLLLLPNIHLVNPYFNWQLIEADKDDNKFVDCAIAANADYIVTHDKHFNVLKKIDFPKVNIINIQELKQLLT